MNTQKQQQKYIIGFSIFDKNINKYLKTEQGTLAYFKYRMKSEKLKCADLELPLSVQNI